MVDPLRQVVLPLSLIYTLFTGPLTVLVVPRVKMSQWVRNHPALAGAWVAILLCLLPIRFFSLGLSLSMGPFFGPVFDIALWLGLFSLPAVPLARTCKSGHPYPLPQLVLRVMGASLGGLIMLVTLFPMSSLFLVLPPSLVDIAVRNFAPLNMGPVAR